MMTESAEDFSVHQFVRDLFEDLSLTLPSLGCRFSGVVTPSALTVRGPQHLLKNKLFLLFADLGSGVAQLETKFRPSVQDANLVLGFGCEPFDDVAAKAKPTWDAEFFSVFESPEAHGFQFVLPAGAPIDLGPPIHWHSLAQMYGGPVIGRQVLVQFLNRCPKMVSELSVSLVAKDIPNSLRIAHSLKGAARGVAAQAVAEAALQLEMVSRSGQLEGASSLFQELEKAVTEMQRAAQESGVSWRA